MTSAHGVVGTLIYVNAVSSWGHVEARLATRDAAVGTRAVLTPPGSTHWVFLILTLINIHTLSAVQGGLEASLTQTVEGALCVDTVTSQTWVCGCTFINILASGAPLSTGKARGTEAEEGSLAVEAFAVRSTVFLPSTLVHVLTRSAIGQPEALGTEALVGTFCVLALSSQAVALGTFTLIHILTGVAQGPGPVAPFAVLAGEGAHSVGADSCGADSREGTFIQVFTGSAIFIHPVPTLTGFAGEGTLGVEAEARGARGSADTLIHISAALLVLGDLIARITRASKGAFHVDATSMGTDSKGQTLIHIYTASTLAYEALLTGQTSVGARGVDASPIRAGSRVTAFVDILAVSFPDHDEAPFTFTVVRALRVVASPTTAYPGLLTLIYVLTLLCISQGG